MMRKSTKKQRGQLQATRRPREKREHQVAVPITTMTTIPLRRQCLFTALSLPQPSRRLPRRRLAAAQS